jgi:hypothetical protein
MSGFELVVVPPLDDPDDDAPLLADVEEPELELVDPLDPEDEPLDPEDEPLDPEDELLPLVEPPEPDVLDDPAFFLAEPFAFELLLPVPDPPWPLPPEPPLPLCEPDAPPDEPWVEPPLPPPAALVVPCVAVVPSKASTLHRTGVVTALSMVPFSTTTTSISP